jgi:DNA-binding beta-propeller fold protein YncE
MNKFTVTMTLSALLAVFYVYPQGNFNQYSTDGEQQINTIMAQPGETVSDYFNSYRLAQDDINPGYLPEGDYPHKMCYSGDGTMVLLANAITDNVTIFSNQTMEPLANVDVGYFPVDVAATTEYAIVPCVFDNKAYVINLSDFSIAGVFDTGEQPCVVKVSHDGTKAFVGCDVDDLVEVIDLENMVHLSTIPNVSIALRSASWISGSGRFYYTWFQFLVSPEDDYLVVSDFDDKIDFYNIESGNIEKSIDGLGNVTELNFSGDGSKLIGVTYTTPSQVHQIDIDSFELSNSVEITGLGIWGGGVAVNPDGTKAFLGVNGNQTALVRFAEGNFSLFPATQTAFWCDNSFDHQYAVSGQFRFSIFDFESELITGYYWGITQYLGAVSPVAYHAVGIDAGRYEGPAFFDFTDVGTVEFRDQVPSGEIPEGDVPYRVAVAKDGSKAVVVNNLSENVSIVNLTDKVVEDIIDMGEMCNAVKITSDAKWAVAGGYDLNTIKIIDLESNELVAAVTTGQRPGMIAIAPDDSYAYVGNIKSNTVSFVKLDGANSVMEKSIPVGIIGLNWSAYGVRSAVEISPSGEFLLVAASFDDNVKVIDTELQEIVAQLPTGDFPLQIAFNSSGSHAIVTNFTDNSYTVMQIDGANSSVVGTFPAANSNPIRLQYNPVNDETSLVHMSNNKTILNVDPETGNVLSSYSYPQYGAPMQIAFDVDGMPLLLTGTVTDGPAYLVYGEEVFDLPASPIHFDYSVDAKVAVVACGGGGQDFISIIDWLAVGTGNYPVVTNAALKTCYMSVPRPNPSSDHVSFDYWISSDFSGSVLVILTDRTGNNLSDKNLPGDSGTGSAGFDVSALPSGIYFITLSAGEHSITKKVLVE